MNGAKLKREMLRVLIQAEGRLGACFPAALGRMIKLEWNSLQMEEGRLAWAPPHTARSGAVALDLSCTSGFGETVHPDVVYVPDGFGYGNWKYLMTVTPFPKGIVYFENPEFLVSRDGVRWETPSGGSSPVVAPPSDWIGYNSDPALLLDGGALRLIYREVREEGKESVVTLYWISSDDGVSWSGRERMLSARAPSGRNGVLMSPALRRLGGEYVLWHVSDDGGSFSIKRASGRSLREMNNTSEVVVTGMPDDLEPWHIGIAEAAGENRLVMAMCASHKEERGIHSIIFAESFDGGYEWRITGERMSPSEAGGERSLYKAALVKGSPASQWRVYYSYRDLEGHWFTCMADVNL